MGAVATALLGALPGAQAATEVYNISGSMGSSLNICFNIAVSLNNRDCSYAHTRTPPTPTWDGPKLGGSFYPKGSIGDNINYSPPAAGNDGKLSPPVSGTLTIDDNGTPADGTDDTISATWIIGAAVFNVSTGNGDKALERWDSMTQVMDATPVNAATPQSGGGFEYIIGSRTVPNVGGTGQTQIGKPTPDPLCSAANPSICWPTELAPATTTGPGFWDPTYGTLPNPANNRIGIERSVGFGQYPPGTALPSPQPNIGGTATGTIQGYECIDNTGDTDCISSESLFGAGLEQYRVESGILTDTATPGYPEPGNCSDGQDNDADGHTDMDDPECVPVATGSAQAVPVPNPPLNMSPPGFDNIILIVVTDGQGSITQARAYWTREYILASGPSIAGEPGGQYTINNSYGAGGIDFTGTLPQAAPIVVDDTFGNASAPGVVQDTATTLNVLANDTAGAPDPNTITITADPAHGTAVPTATGITYTPAQFYTGPDTFDYTVTDGDGDADSGTVTLYVSNKTPTAGTFNSSSSNGAATSAIPVLGSPTLLGTGTAAQHTVAAGAGTLGSCAVTGSGASQALVFTPTPGGGNGSGGCDYTLTDADGDPDGGRLNVQVSGNAGGGGGGGGSGGPQLPSGGSSLDLVALGALAAAIARRRALRA
jgi:hypothetical protein